MELTELKFLTQEQLVELIKEATALLDDKHLVEVNEVNHYGWWDCSK